MILSRLRHKFICQFQAMKKFIPLVVILPLFASAQNVGIGVPIPTEKLHVDGGNVKIGGPIWSAGNDRVLRFGDGDFVHIGEVGGDDHMEIKAAQQITLTSNALNISVGTPAAGNVLTSDASGNATWQAVPGATAAFKVDMASSQSVPAGTTTSLNFTLAEYNYGGIYNTTYGYFNAPANGLYHFDVKLLWNLSVGAPRYSMILSLYSPGFIPTEVGRTEHFIEAGASGIATIELSMDKQLAAGESVYVTAYQNSGTSQTVINSLTSFSCHRVF